MSMPEIESPSLIKLSDTPDDGDVLSIAGPESNELLAALYQDCRSYLLEVATHEMPEDLRLCVAPSDLVQDAFTDAIQDVAKFRGETKAELFRWMRKILLHNIYDARRFFFDTQKRKATRNQSLDDGLWGEQARDRIAAPRCSPSSGLRRDEDATLLHASIDRLPENYRLVIRLRHFEGLPLDEVGRQLGRSSEAVRKLWFRAVEKLTELVEYESESSRR